MNNLPDQSSDILGWIIFLYVAWSVYTTFRWAGKDIAWRHNVFYSGTKRIQTGTIWNRLKIITLIPAVYAVVKFTYIFCYVVGPEVYEFFNIGIRGLYEYYIK